MDFPFFEHFVDAIFLDLEFFSAEIIHGRKRGFFFSLVDIVPWW